MCLTGLGKIDIFFDEISSVLVLLQAASQLTRDVYCPLPVPGSEHPWPGVQSHEGVTTELDSKYVDYSVVKFQLGEFVPPQTILDPFASITL